MKQGVAGCKAAGGACPTGSICNDTTDMCTCQGGYTAEATSGKCSKYYTNTLIYFTAHTYCSMFQTFTVCNNTIDMCTCQEGYTAEMQENAVSIIPIL